MCNNGGIRASGRNVVIAFINKDLFGLKAQHCLIEVSQEPISGRSAKTSINNAHLI